MHIKHLLLILAQVVMVAIMISAIIICNICQAAAYWKEHRVGS